MQQKTTKAMRLSALLEGCTLVLLLAVAVPLKHIAGNPVGVSIMGPVHGLAFVAYLWVVVKECAEGTVPVKSLPCLVGVAFIPLGAFLLLRRNST